MNSKHFVSALMLVAQGVLAGAADAAVTALVGGTVVDLGGGPALEDAVVLVDGDRISAIGARGTVDIPAEAERVDAAGKWLVPGLMNMHVHLGLVLPGKMAAELAGETDAALALRMAAAAREILQAGVTTIRTPGDTRHAELALDRSIRKGESQGPRIHAAGEALVITGGHGSEPGVLYADGPDELTKAARQQISLGAKWVKILISGGIATDGGAIAEALMTPEEINAVVDAAHRFGAKVAAHSGSSAATSVAVDAGIDSVEHGYTLDRKVLRKMHKAGTWLVPTIVVSQPATAPFFERIGSPQWYLDRRNSVGKLHWEALKTAIEEDVNIALGTDQLPHEPNDGTTATVREAEYYVEAGMTPLDALRAATIEPARMLGADDESGSLAVGKYADIVALRADPLADIGALRTINFVMKGGIVYRNDDAR
ncbi:amidohydrolase family protein [Pseudohaliea rubra]|uniref:Xaa-Pro dipeptidase family enzyme n=1 Tax=Pseudohaliea rubra DSM 19751 TaxID=1265313 RepID=A0A095VMZ8_9GAMM|nr:amidohydrolase family protein [Pseudohaliea rubra]KGE02745.1 Xaa-Pro dipeptidase family enzyme [Pseudohaliea rubra DSM 19751]